ncbi:dihydroorotase, partial [Salmonella enterica subsp. enterica serovar Poona]
LEACWSRNGPHVYGLPVNPGGGELVRDEQQIPENIALADDSLVPFLAGETVRWSVKK